MLLSIELEKILTQFGVAKVSTTSNKTFAEAAINHNTFEIPILDINHGGETSIELAIELRKPKSACRVSNWLRHPISAAA